MNYVYILVILLGIFKTKAYSITPQDLTDKCGKHCTNCSKDNLCTECTNSRVLVLKDSHANVGTCVKTPDTNCFFIAPYKCYTCYNPEENCCIFGCNTCLNSGICEICEQGFQLTVTESGDNICKPTCDHGIEVSGECKSCHNSCETCKSPLDETACLSCRSGRVLEEGRCVCPSGLAENKETKECEVCGDRCDECAEPGDNSKCLECSPGFYLYKGSCLDSCPEGTETNEFRRKCETYRPRLAACPSNCATCRDYLYSENCKTCHPHSYLRTYDNTWSASGLNMLDLYKVRCSSCGSTYPAASFVKSDMYCYNCQPAGPPTYYRHDKDDECTTCNQANKEFPSPEDGTCYICHEDCETCRSPNNANECLSCKSFKALVSDTIGRCTNKCPSGTANYTATPGSNYKCLPCHSSCLECSTVHADGCSECYNSISEIGGVCTYCPVGQYLADDGTCANNITNGQGCTSGEYLELPSGYCISSCSNHIKDELNKICSSCDTSCNTCSEPSDPKKCLGCSGNLVLNVLSLNPNAGECISSCPPGKSSDGSHCILCDASCDTCDPNEPTKCLTCSSGRFTLDNGTISCLLSCPSGYYAGTNDKCKKCDPACLECDDAGNDNCIECINGYDFYGNPTRRCERCISSTIYNTTERKCLPCHFSCESCTVAYSSTDCTSCIPGLALYGTTCISTCPDGYYLSSPDCLPCDPSCTTCIDNANSCLKCGFGVNSNQLLKVLTELNDDKDPDTIPGICVEPCPDNTYLSPSKTVCLPSCPKGTRTKSNSSECLECDPSCVECLLPGDPSTCTSCKRYLQIQTDTFNQTLSDANGGELYGYCVDVCEANDYKDYNNNICYAYKSKEIVHNKQQQYHNGRTGGIIADSLM